MDKSIPKLPLKSVTRRQGRLATGMIILKLDVVNIGLRARTRALRYHRSAMRHEIKDPKLSIAISAEARACDELAMRVSGHPLPGRGKAQPEKYRTLDIEPSGPIPLSPPPPLDSGMDSGLNGHADSLENDDTTK